MNKTSSSMPTSFYLLSAYERKADINESVVESGGVIIIQVLNEFVDVCQRKFRMDWSDTCFALIVIRSVCTIKPLTEGVHDLGTIVCEKYKLSVYDSMTVAAALEADCTKLLSEDIRAGLLIKRRLIIENPF